MRLTKREKILISIMLLIVIGGLSYTFLYTPQFEKIAELELSIEEIEAEIKRVEAESKSDSDIMIRQKVLNARIMNLTYRFLPGIMQDRIIVMLDEFITDAGIDAFTIGFESPSAKQIQLPVGMDEESTILNELQESVDGSEQLNNDDKPLIQGEPTPVESMKVAIQVQGKYDNIIDFLETVQNYHYNIVVNNINLAVAEFAEHVSGNISLEFFALPKLHEQDLDFLEWNFDNIYGRFNPFVRAGQSNQRGDSGFTNRREDFDFVMTAKPITADLPTVMIGRANDSANITYVHADNAGFENVKFEVFMKNDKYYFRYRTQTESYPTNYSEGIEFMPKGKNIVLQVFCNPRTHDKDQSGINLTAINQTDLKLVLQITNEDKNRPRINVVKKDGQIVIRR
ncbi:MAG: hypothetical protein LR001_10075 [Clostridiales bacterium]|nr:hypothetical protein [Clostridiales bacterium]